MNTPETSPTLSAGQVLSELQAYGLGPALDAALTCYRKSGELRRSRPALTPECWLALGRLTGRHQETLDLALLDEKLRASRFGTPLVEVLAALHGAPVQSRKAEREQQTRDHEEQFRRLLLSVNDAPWQALLKEHEAGASTLRRELRQGRWPEHDVRLVSLALGALQDAADLGHVPPLLPVLAAAISGNAHALDRNTLPGTLLKEAVNTLGLTPPARDGLSSTVLIANLRGGWLNHLPPGTVLALPLREVTRLPELHAPEDRVYVVENPAVCEGLLNAHPDTPVICVSGQASHAATTLLGLLRPGTEAHLSCDHDLGGLNIARHLLRLPLDWHLWRMDPGSYELACSRGTLPLPKRPDGEWGRLAPLADALSCRGLASHQELLLPELIADTQQSGHRQGQAGPAPAAGL